MNRQQYKASLKAAYEDYLVVNEEYAAGQSEQGRMDPDRVAEAV